MVIQNSPSHKAFEVPKWKYWTGNSLIFTDQKKKNNPFVTIYSPQVHISHISYCQLQYSSLFHVFFFSYIFVFLSYLYKPNMPGLSSIGSAVIANDSRCEQGRHG